MKTSLKGILGKIQNHRFDSIAIFLLLGLSIFFKLYHATLFMPFGWDQERDAFAIWNIVKNHDFTLIGPRAVGPTGFFLGPYWYYLLAPFYILSNMHPIGAAYFLAFVTFLTSVLLYFYLRRHTSPSIALLLTSVYTTHPDRTIFNPNLVMFFCIMLIFLLENLNTKNKKLAPFAFLLVGIAINFHFILILLIIPLFYWTHHILKGQRYFQNLTLYAAAFLLPFAPLILFDLRHDFLNTHALLSFFTHQNPPINLMSFAARFESVNLNFSAGIGNLMIEVQKHLGLLWGYLLAGLAILGIIFHHDKKITKVALLSFLLFPPLSFLFYKNSIAQYYFEIGWVSVLLGIGLWLHLLLRKNSYLLAALIVVIVLLLNYRYQKLLGSHPTNTFYYKEQAVKYITNNPRGEKNIFVSFKMPPGQDVGFRYLLQYFGNPAQDPDPKNVHYSVLFPVDYNTDKPDVVFGDFGVVRRN